MGIDPTRMTLYSYAAPGRDGKTSRALMDERAKNYRTLALNFEIWQIYH